MARYPTYTVAWSEEDGEFVATCDWLPSMSWLALEPDAALQGLLEVLSQDDDAVAAAGMVFNRKPSTLTADAVLSIIPAPVQPMWRCICTGQGGETHPQDCPLHDRSVDTENEAWRKRYVAHLDKQVQIAKRLGWTP